ncbi:paraquat-inducible protein A [Rhizobium daejeonense]|uniref:Paraquat-inducible protein A n=1 Tax=Rhizobium daejeonense TaxID=240521 RepID=A0A6M1RM74_9HYPH|nr:paraquat-inducible protein A [Rhizobium daejeonense]NGO62372.1 paraquat-inducible protein A [Rhizobium daejeonense]
MLWLKSIALLAAPAFLTLGLMLPLVRFETLYFFSETPSLLVIVASLWQGGDETLAILVALLSIVFPAIKLLGLTAEALAPVSSPADGDLLRRLVPILAKWSMMDVLLVALVIVAAKTSGLAEAFTQPGLWFYAGSALIAGLLPALIKRPQSG